MLSQIFVSLLLASTAEQPVRPLTLPGPTWDYSNQFLSSDRKGRVNLLRTATLDLYAVTPDGLAAEPRSLARGKGAESTSTVLRAVEGSDESWLLLRGPHDLTWLKDGEPASLPGVEWQVLGVGFCGDTPLLSVGPAHRASDEEAGAAGPLVVSPSSDRWSAVLDARGRRSSDSESDLRVERDMVFAASTGSRVWAATAFAYRVRELTCGGRVLDEIVVDDGKSKQHEGEAAQKMQAEFTRKVTEQLGGKLPEGAVIEVFLGRRVIQGLAEGRDGRLYLVVDEGATDAGLAIDRYDPGVGTLERVELDLDYQGLLSVAAGTDALYLASVNGSAGRWYIPWTTLDAADWRAVPGFELDQEARQEEP